MKVDKLLIFALYFSAYVVHAQVGIGTVAPQAQLDVVTEATATSERKGIQVDLNSMSTAQQNTYSLHLTNSSSPSLTASKYGIFSNVSGAGTATRYGVYSEVFQPSVSPTATDLFGVYSFLGLSTGINKNAYGFYADISNVNNTANIFGVYSTVAGTVANQDVYSGYFQGGKFSIGQTTADNYILPGSRGTANQIMQTDGSGNVAWVDATTVGDSDHDWYEEGTTTLPDDINDDIFTQGNVAIGKNTADWRLEVEEPNGGRGVFILMNGNSPNITYGLLSEVTNSGDNTHVGLYGRILGNGDGAHRALETSTTGSGSGPHYGLYSSLSGSGGGPQFGVRTIVSNTGDDLHYGAYNELTGTGSGSKHGIYNLFDNNSNGVHYGIRNDMETVGVEDQFGVYNQLASSNADMWGAFNRFTAQSNFNYGTENIFDVSGNSGALKFGLKNQFNDNTTSGAPTFYGTHNTFSAGSSNINSINYGGYNLFDGDSNSNVGYFNRFNTDDDTVVLGQYGFHNEFSLGSNSISPLIGLNNQFLDNLGSPLNSIPSTDMIVGVYNNIEIPNVNSIDIYGVKNVLDDGSSGTTNGSAYGVYSNIITGATNSYGVYSENLNLSGNRYAGYFLGRVSFGTTTANSYVFPLSRGSANQILQTDGAGNVSWVNNNPVSLIPIYSNGSYFMNNTAGQDLTDMDTALEPTIYNASGNIEVKLVVRYSGATGTNNLQLRAHDGTTETYPIVNIDTWTFAATQTGGVATSQWKAWNAGTNAFEIHLYGWAGNFFSNLTIVSAYLLVRSQ